MSERSRWDPEMRTYQRAAEATAADCPPVRLELPLEPHRLVNDAISRARDAVAKAGAWMKRHVA